MRGLDVTIATSAATDVEAFELLLRGDAVRQRGPAGGRDLEAEAAAEEEKRKEEAVRAEAEQAALEQLEEENPDAYAKPEPEAEEGEGAAEGDDRGGREARPRGEFRGWLRLR